MLPASEFYEYILIFPVFSKHTCHSAYKPPCPTAGLIISNSGFLDKKKVIFHS